MKTRIPAPIVRYGFVFVLLASAVACSSAEPGPAVTESVSAHTQQVTVADPFAVAAAADDDLCATDAQVLAASDLTQPLAMAPSGGTSDGRLCREQNAPMRLCRMKSAPFPAPPRPARSIRYTCSYDGEVLVELSADLPVSNETKAKAWAECQKACKAEIKANALP